MIAIYSSNNSILNPYSITKNILGSYLTRKFLAFVYDSLINNNNNERAKTKLDLEIRIFGYF